MDRQSLLVWERLNSSAFKASLVGNIFSMITLSTSLLFSPACMASEEPSNVTVNSCSSTNKVLFSSDSF